MNWRGLLGRGHLIENRGAEIALGLVLFAGGALLLRDAYEGRGREVPVFARPFTFW